MFLSWLCYGDVNHSEIQTNNELIAFETSAQASELLPSPGRSSLDDRLHPIPLPRRQSSPPPRQQPLETIAGVSPLSTKSVRLDNFSVRNTIAASPGNQILSNRVGEDNRRKDVEEEEDGDGEEEAEENEDNDEDWLEMSKSSMQNDNVTIDHSKEQKLEFSGNNSSILSPGRVITIDDSDIHYSSRTMVVMAKSDEGALQCISLCSHPRVGPKDYPNLSPAHLPVYSAKDDHIANTKEYFKTQVIIDFDDTDSTLIKSSWINCQHVWTVRSAVRCYIEGEIQNFKEVMRAFRTIQRKLYNDDSDR